MTRLATIVVAVIASSTWAATPLTAAPESISFPQQIAPLLAEHCYECHGAQAQESGLRLDQKESAFDRLPSGSVAVLPAEPAESELLQRVSSTNPQQRMPPPEHGRGLTADEIGLLRRWIAGGATWSKHWSFERPLKSQLPEVHDRSWPRNPIDRYIAAERHQQGFTASPPASREMLARRAAYALTGLPPTSEQLQVLLDDKSPLAYQRYLDRLFASPHYGEQMATAWLDLARYADTHGFHTDSHRDMWRWRDWVIAAYNSHMPLDRFITEQLAGDLLPAATDSQRLATGFQRNHMINFENGALAEEYRNLYVVDRVNTMGSVMLGLTVSCAQCHDHKYDPLSQQEYYSLYAFFNNIPEQGLDGEQGNAAPLMKAPTLLQQQELQRLAGERAAAAEVLARRSTQAKRLAEAWVKSQREESGREDPGRGERGEGSDWSSANSVWQFSLNEQGSAGAIAYEGISERWVGSAFGSPLFLPAAKYQGGLMLSPGAGLTLDPPVSLEPAGGMTWSVWCYPTTADPMTLFTLTDVDQWEWNLERGKLRVRQQLADGQQRTYSTGEAIGQNRWSHLVFRYQGGKQPRGEFYLNGKPLETTTAESHGPAHDVPQQPRLTISTSKGTTPFKGMLDELRGYRQALSPRVIAELSQSTPLAEIMRLPAAQRTAGQQQRLEQYYMAEIDPPARQAAEAIRRASNRRAAILRAAPTSMVMQERSEPRETHRLVRGDYRRPGATVPRATPAVLHDWPTAAPRNRLGLARWLVDPNNPLTARVFVNRHWRQIFGQALVPTSADFGLRGQPPTHPALLDWLAVELVESGWDLQHLQRLMLTSATFRQTSHVSAELMSADPTNRYYTRYGRTSLTAEQVRDTSLLAAGLLQSEVGGESVFPYQPEGLWEAISYDPQQYTAQVYRQSQGADLYRRSLYTFWKRSLPPPALAAFNAPTRETCTVERSTSVTPGQALVIWNDPAHLQAARQVAERVMRKKSTSRGRIAVLYRSLLSRLPTEAEAAIMTTLIREQTEETPAAVDAWSIAAQTLMMTDEYLSRP